MTQHAAVGCLLGTAVGDALGLPYEGIRPARARRMFGDLGRHRFILTKGMCSDDTEHACFVAQALTRSGRDPHAFQRQLARSLRWWLLGMPAGVGFATLRAGIKLWLGFPPTRSGVFSAGNGPAMRSPLLGVLFGARPDTLEAFVLASTRLTHTDPRAYAGALVVALAAFESSRAARAIATADFVRAVEQRLRLPEAAELIGLVRRAARSADNGDSTAQFAAEIGCRNGVSGYILHTVPCVLQTWLRFQDDFAGGIREILAAGGDTDTTAAILGGIIGARVGKGGIPTQWLNGIVEWPRCVAWIEKLAAAASPVADGQPARPAPRYVRVGVIPRNLVFLLIVLSHGLRRLAPPY
jgi:ADP-ribosylglycohydrolase